MDYLTSQAGVSSYFLFTINRGRRAISKMVEFVKIFEKANFDSSRIDTGQ